MILSVKWAKKGGCVIFDIVENYTPYYRKLHTIIENYTPYSKIKYYLCGKFVRTNRQ